MFTVHGAPALRVEILLSMRWSAVKVLLEQPVHRGTLCGTIFPSRRLLCLRCRLAAWLPAIIFIDEIDAVGRTRGGAQGNDERDQTLNQMLSEMDGFQNSAQVIVMAATNRQAPDMPLRCAQYA